METIIILTIASEILAFSSTAKMEEHLRKNASGLGLSDSDIKSLLEEKVFDNDVADFAYDIINIDADL